MFITKRVKDPLPLKMMVEDMTYLEHLNMLVLVLNGNKIPELLFELSTYTFKTE